MIPPIVGFSIKMLYINIIDEVQMTLLRRSCASPKDINIVLAASAIMTRSEIGPSHERNPRPPITMARMIAEIIFIFDFESWKKNAILRMMQTILSAKPESAPKRR
jgi:hypothetical protein